MMAIASNRRRENSRIIDTNVATTAQIRNTLDAWWFGNAIDIRELMLFIIDIIKKWLNNKLSIDFFKKYLPL